MTAHSGHMVTSWQVHSDAWNTQGTWDSYNHHCNIDCEIMDVKEVMYVDLLLNMYHKSNLHSGEWL